MFRIFESYMELIQRGKRDKPMEFGHKIVLSQTVEKFITDDEVFLPTCAHLLLGHATPVP